MDFCSAGKDQKSCPPGGASTQNMFQKLKGSYSWLSLKVWKCTFLAIFKIFKDLQYQLKIYTKISDIVYLRKRFPLFLFSDVDDHFKNTKQVFEELALEKYSDEDCRIAQYVCSLVSTRAAFLASVGKCVCRVHSRSYIAYIDPKRPGPVAIKLRQAHSHFSSLYLFWKRETEIQNKWAHFRSQSQFFTVYSFCKSETEIKIEWWPSSAANYCYS